MPAAKTKTKQRPKDVADMFDAHEPNPIVIQEPEQKTSSIQPFGDESVSPDFVAALVERQKQILQATLEVTHWSDWTAWPIKNQEHETIGHRWEIGRKGAMKIARLFGLSITDWKDVREDEGNGHFTFRYRATFTMGLRSSQSEGAYSSYDKFLGSPNAAEVNPANIRKAAISNCIKHGIADILGLGNFDDETITAFFEKKGWKPTNLQFTKGAQGGDTRKQSDKDLQMKILEMVMDMANGDKVLAPGILERITYYKSPDGQKEIPGLKSSNALMNVKGKRLFAIFKSVEKKWKESQPPEDR